MGVEGRINNSQAYAPSECVAFRLSFVISTRLTSDASNLTGELARGLNLGLHREEKGGS